MSLSKQVEQLEETVKRLEQKNQTMADTLRRIAKWHGEFPLTERTWPHGTPMSYGAAWGSNGERDYMRQVAEKALS